MKTIDGQAHKTLTEDEILNETRPAQKTSKSNILWIKLKLVFFNKFNKNVNKSRRVIIKREEVSQIYTFPDLLWERGRGSYSLGVFKFRQQPKVDWDEKKEKSSYPVSCDQ